MGDTPQVRHSIKNPGQSCLHDPKITKVLTERKSCKFPLGKPSPSSQNECLVYQSHSQPGPPRMSWKGKDLRWSLFPQARSTAAGPLSVSGSQLDPQTTSLYLSSNRKQEAGSHISCKFCLALLLAEALDYRASVTTWNHGLTALDWERPYDLAAAQWLRQQSPQRAG